ncbi:MAG: hypothetical protein RSB39_09715 [Oscillospiraceae bacterium]
MSNWTKGDGAKISIRFSEPIISGVVGSEGAFSVVVPEYDYVPGGALRDVAKAVLSVSAGANASMIILEMPPLERFENAAGNITVVYNGAGGLAGYGGSVAAFTQSFAPTELIPKPDQNDAEHIEIKSIAATGTLTKINYTDTASQDMGHIEIVGITATGKLTHIKDI